MDTEKRNKKQEEKKLVRASLTDDYDSNERWIITRKQTTSWRKVLDSETKCILCGDEFTSVQTNSMMMDASDMLRSRCCPECNHYSSAMPTIIRLQRQVTGKIDFTDNHVVDNVIRMLNEMETFLDEINQISDTRC